MYNKATDRHGGNPGPSLSDLPCTNDTPLATLVAHPVPEEVFPASP